MTETVSAASSIHFKIRNPFTMQEHSNADSIQLGHQTQAPQALFALLTGAGEAFAACCTVLLSMGPSPATSIEFDRNTLWKSRDSGDCTFSSCRLSSTRNCIH